MSEQVPPTPVPSQEDLQRLHEQRIANLERHLDEARRFIAVNSQQIAMIRQMLGLPGNFREGSQAS